MITEYKTIKKPSEGIYKEKGSKFLAYAFNVTTEEEITEKLLEVRKLHPKARHHCYGYRIGVGQTEKYRANDDGEPSSSAGKPIYGQLLSFEITNALVVVVRYFGGTKLGVGGLITAYKSATKDALENNEIITRELRNFYKINFDYMTMSDVMNIVKTKEVEITKQVFEEACEIIFSVSLPFSDSVILKLDKFEGVEVLFLEVG
jgi:uncharacterized YigZ family protein